MKILHFRRMELLPIILIVKKETCHFTVKSTVRNNVETNYFFPRMGDRRWHGMLYSESDHHSGNFDTLSRSIISVGIRNFYRRIGWTIHRGTRARLYCRIISFFFLFFYDALIHENYNTHVALWNIIHPLSINYRVFIGPSLKITSRFRQFF